MVARLVHEMESEEVAVGGSGDRQRPGARLAGALDGAEVEVLNACRLFYELRQLLEGVGLDELYPDAVER